ncbi:hypothetical protein BK648_01345 [Pseudomonas poae]|uniref:Uncharacterized protein n=1 Tax=Pseudomonas poae TaxID=200451 RepID=A0A423FHF3_9PSED|nr:hypothetical protein BK648_01345 [Pseudomonas poae]
MSRGWALRMSGARKAGHDCPPGITLIEQRFETRLRTRWVRLVVQALKQPQRAVGGVLGERPRKVIQAGCAQAHPVFQLGIGGHLLSELDAE